MARPRLSIYDYEDACRVHTDISERDPRRQRDCHISDVILVCEDSHELISEHGIRCSREQTTSDMDDDREPVHHFGHPFGPLSHVLRDPRCARRTYSTGITEQRSQSAMMLM